MRKTTLGATAAIAVLAGLIAAGPAPAAPATTPTATVTPTASAGQQVAKTASVHGKARISYIESLDDDIRFTIDAVQKPFSRTWPGNASGRMATDAWGTLKFSHTTPSGAGGWAEAEVDCLVTSGRTATLTAVVTKSNVEEVGARLGISVQQGAEGEPDRLGFSWGVANIDPGSVDEKGDLVRPQAGTCMAPAPFTTVIKGGFKVVHADIRKSPAQPGAASRRG
ncbi:hypothetical protein ACFU9B_10330 [Streptomyces sp. NPDC057592]|uniref:hypothetical protein n=1 Tax=unclassified Streptomyces TaxID=2593676 RepID=UPI0036CAE48D